MRWLFQIQILQKANTGKSSFQYAPLTAKEYSELSGTPRKESENQLNELVSKEKLEKHATINGYIWNIVNKNIKLWKHTNIQTEK